MKTKVLKDTTAKDAIAHQKLWNAISDEDSSQLKGGAPRFTISFPCDGPGRGGTCQ